jgi:hypothetical protein
MKPTQQISSNLSQVSRLVEARSRVIAYFWGAKLARFVKELELVRPDDFPNGFGDIQALAKGYQCQFKVHSDDYGGLHEVEAKRYKNIMELIEKYINDRISMNTNFIDDLNEMGGSMVKRDF